MSSRVTAIVSTDFGKARQLAIDYDIDNWVLIDTLDKARGRTYIDYLFLDFPEAHRTELDKLIRQNLWCGVEGVFPRGGKDGR